MPRSPRLSRRTALAGALVAPVAVAACDIDPPVDPDASTGPDGGLPADGDDDVALVVEVLDHVHAALAVATAATLRPASADLAARLTLLHEAQVTVLGGAVPDDAAPDQPQSDEDDEEDEEDAATPDDVGGGRGLVPAERALQRVLVRSAATARSGDLARVLASAAAAIAQQLAVHDLARSRP